MADSTYYRDAAKENIIIHLDQIKKDKYLLFGKENSAIKKIIFNNVPFYGISDDELLVITDNVIKFLQQNPNDFNHSYPQLPENIRFYYRFVNAMIDLFDRALVNVVGAKRFVNSNFTSVKSMLEGTFGNNLSFITINDILDALEILGKYGIPKDEIMTLRNCIVMGLKSISNENIHVITV